MKLAAAALLALLIFAAAGCDGSDEDQAEDTVLEYVDAVAEGDGAKACEQLTSEGQEAVAEGDCPKRIERLSANLSEGQRDAFAEAEVVEVTIDGDQGTVRLTTPDQPEDDPEAYGIVPVEKQDGDWKISPPERGTSG